MKTHKATCKVCGARRVWGNTCDSVCTRANAAGRSRGQQIAAELTRFVKAGWEGISSKPPNPFAYTPGNDYNFPLHAAA